MIFVDKLLNPSECESPIDHPMINPHHPDDWMKITEELASVLNEMSVTRSRLEAVLGQYHFVIYWHLLKLFYFRNNTQQYFNNWCTSVWKGLASIPTLKKAYGKDKLPGAQFIYDKAWGDYSDSFERWHKSTLDDFNDKSNPEFRDLPYIHAGGDCETAELFVKDYYIWLAKELEKKGKISLSEVRDKIKELLSDSDYAYKPR